MHIPIHVKIICNQDDVYKVKDFLTPNKLFHVIEFHDVARTSDKNSVVLDISGVVIIGYSDFSEWFIGHSGSTYWTKKDSDKAEIFRKIEPYLTFLNIHQLERQGADIQTKVEELEDLNQSLRNRDKMKDDAISQLSDQLVALTTRMQDLERKQQV